jgi:hypothetical protein
LASPERQIAYIIDRASLTVAPAINSLLSYFGVLFNWHHINAFFVHNLGNDLFLKALSFYFLPNVIGGAAENHKVFATWRLYSAEHYASAQGQPLIASSSTSGPLE